LRSEVARVYASGDRIKVAVIATPFDLGSVPSLFNHPTSYAQFLGLEIKFAYVGPLLVVMPAGYGVYDGGRSTVTAERVVRALGEPDPSSDALTRGAATAVARLLAAGALKSPDTRAPYTNAVGVRGRPGQRVRLVYDVADDSGRSSVVIRVRAGSRVLATFRETRTGISGVKSFAVVWRVPTLLPKAKLSFCVTATDAAGNRSKPWCARILTS
jgi:hypothetical protein